MEQSKRLRDRKQMEEQDTMFIRYVEISMPNSYLKVLLRTHQ